MKSQNIIFIILPRTSKPKYQNVKQIETEVSGAFLEKNICQHHLRLQRSLEQIHTLFQTAKTRENKKKNMILS